MEKIALVTGGSRGFGKAICLRLAQRGDFVALISRGTGQASQVCDEITNKGGKAIYLKCDVRQEDEVREVVGEIVRRLGRIDILVNNAGIGSVSPLWETPTDVWDDIMAVNLRGVFLCSKHVVPHMISQRSGRIINISSVVGRQAQAMVSAYSTSKAGVIAMTVSLAKEVAGYGITVNAVCPGPVETSWWDEPKKLFAKALNVSEAEVLNRIRDKQFIKTPLSAEDVANVVFWLTTDETRLITGQYIGVDGGHEFPMY